MFVLITTWLAFIWCCLAGIGLFCEGKNDKGKLIWAMLTLPAIGRILNFW